MSSGQELQTLGFNPGSLAPFNPNMPIMPVDKTPPMVVPPSPPNIVKAPPGSIPGGPVTPMQPQLAPPLQLPQQPFTGIRNGLHILPGVMR